jgi:ribosomal protein S13
MVRLVGVDLPRNKKITYALLIFTELVLHLQKKLLKLQHPETRVN